MFTFDPYVSTSEKWANSSAGSNVIVSPFAELAIYVIETLSDWVVSNELELIIISSPTAQSVVYVVTKVLSYALIEFLTNVQ